MTGILDMDWKGILPALITIFPVIYRREAGPGGTGTLETQLTIKGDIAFPLVCDDLPAGSSLL